jgi:hypothetical protein
MIQLCSAITMSDSVFYFERYMFAVTERHVKRHASFDDVEIGICDGKRSVILYGDDVQTIEQRESCMKMFNNILANHGLKLSSVDRLPNSIAYFGVPMDYDEGDWRQDYTDWKTWVLDYAMTKNCVLAWVVHSSQKAKDSDNFSYPHVHVLFDDQGGDINALNEWITEKSLSKVPDDWVDAS